MQGIDGGWRVKRLLNSGIFRQNAVMNHLVEQTAAALIGRLPAGARYFSLSDLESAGFPDFLVRRISMELENNLASSIVPPKSDWADMQAEPVIAAWEHFLYAIHEATRMPAVHAKTVIETSVEDLLDLVVEPRTQVLNNLFGREQVLKTEELSERVSWLVVFGFLGEAIVKYAQRKSLESVSREQAEKIIAAIDDKIVASFTPLTWVQSLDPFFSMVGDLAEPDVLARYFADRNRPKLADLLHRRSAAISRTDLVELLSLPDFDEAAAEASYMKHESVAGKIVETPAVPQLEIQMEAPDTAAQPDDEVPFDAEQIGQPLGGTEEMEPEFLEKQVEPQSERFDDVVEEKKMPPAEEKPLFARFVQENVEKTPPVTAETPAEPLWKRFSQPAGSSIIDLTGPSAVPDPRLDRLQFLLSDKKETLLFEIFAGDEDAWNATLETLAAFKEWPPAGKYIASDIFKKNKVNMYSEPAIDFLDRIQSFFLEQRR